MRVSSGIPFVVILSLSLPSATAQKSVAGDSANIVLRVPAGAPLRVYLTRGVTKKSGVPVQAKVLEPVFAFDREVVPAGSIALGTVVRLEPAGKWTRVRAILNGDFTPLHRALVGFDTLILPDGRRLPMHTVETAGLNSFYVEPPKKVKKGKPPSNSPNGGVLGTLRGTATDRINGAINARSRGLADIVRAPNKKEKLVDLMWSKLPYHPQYVRRGARFDAELREPLEFGAESVKRADLSALGGPLPADSVAHVRLLTSLNSGSAKLGQEVDAMVTQPMYSPDHKLEIPEGTRLTGVVVVAKPARSFHRAGQLRFSFQKIDLPQEVANLRPAAAPPRTNLDSQATLSAAEGGGPAAIQVDSEGGVQAKETKTRFLAPMISLVLAGRAADNDAGRQHAGGSAGAQGNVSGRTLGGGSGFGMLGAAVSQTSPYVGMAFAYYGLAWTVYSSVIGRGGEVEFDRNAMMEVRFGARAK